MPKSDSANNHARAAKKEQPQTSVMNRLKLKSYSINGIASFISFMVFFLSYVDITHASSVTGTVSSYFVRQKRSYPSDTFFFSINSTIASIVACNTASRYAVPLNTDYGKAIKDQIMSAKNNNLTINVKGMGTCTTWPDSEDVDYVFSSGDPTITISESGIPVAPINGYWATVSGVANCYDTCNFAGAIGEANSDGNVCKGLDGVKLLAGPMVISDSNYHSWCTGGGSIGTMLIPLAQCYCVKK